MTPRTFRIADKRDIASDAFAFVLEPADGDAMFAFAPGQFVMVHLYNADGTVWAKSAYSAATAPSESTERFEIGVRDAGDFTKRLRGLSVGDTVGVQGPYGAFILRGGARSVFFAGGIGITPIRSMIREALLAKKPDELFLFYCNRIKDAIAYEQEFRDLASSHPNFHPVFALERDIPDGWDGETGCITADIVTRHVPVLDGADFYACGPSPFMDAVKSILGSKGVDLKTQLIRESF